MYEGVQQKMYEEVQQKMDPRHEYDVRVEELPAVATTSSVLPQKHGAVSHKACNGAPDTASCPRGHALQEFNAEHGGYSCDRCHQYASLGSTLRGCRTCDFDLCSKCSQISTAATGAASAAGAAGNNRVDASTVRQVEGHTCSFIAPDGHILIYGGQGQAQSRAIGVRFVSSDVFVARHVVKELLAKDKRTGTGTGTGAAPSDQG
jgi:hypothetical protein